jgi:hypothetical protein
MQSVCSTTRFINQLQSLANLRNVVVKMNNGEMYCQFDRKITPTVTDDGKIFPLNSPCMCGCKYFYETTLRGSAV